MWIKKFNGVKHKQTLNNIIHQNKTSSEKMYTYLSTISTKPNIKNTKILYIYIK